MMPLLICIPVLKFRHGYTCGVPSHRLLLFVSALFVCLLVPIGLLNLIDNDDRTSIGSCLVALFTLGILSFVTAGVIGVRSVSRLWITATFWLWIVVYIGFICVCFGSVYNRDTLDKASVNGRCPVTLWLFDWCEQVASRSNRIPPETTTQSPLHGRMAWIRLKRNITHIGYGIDRKIPPGGPEYRALVFYYLGIIFFSLAVITLFTFYGAIIYDLKHQLNWPPPQMTVEGPEEVQGGNAERINK